MKQLCKNLALLIVCASTMHMHAESTVFGKTFFEQRPQGQNLARWESGLYHNLYLYNTDCANGTLSITPFYSQTFNEKEIGRWFFFNGNNVMRFGPAGTEGVDVFARNFFLNDDFNGFIEANPITKNFLVDLNFYLGLDEWVPGLYFRIDVPVNWTSWDMRLTESLDNRGNTIAANRLGNTTAQSSPVKSIIEAWKGETLQTADFPDLKQPLSFGRIDGKQTKGGVADVYFILGYNFINNEVAHLGFNFWAVAPTGTRPDGQYVYEPIIGNGRHPAVGGGITSHYELWNNGADQSFGLLAEGYAVHLFRARQKRTFDLKENGPGSRYLLIKRFDSDGIYANEVLFGPNVLTTDIKVQNDVTGEVLAMFDYQNGGFTFDAGYNLWGRTSDKIEIVNPIPTDTYGIQGNTTTSDAIGMNPNVTQSLTTIDGTFAPATPEDPPVFLNTGDLDIDSAKNPGALSHTIFTHIAYTWENCDYLPFIGLGGSVEFSGRGNRAFDQWAVWLKGGFTFC